jgi:hypothetical protein
MSRAHASTSVRRRSACVKSGIESDGDHGPLSATTLTTTMILVRCDTHLSAIASRKGRRAGGIVDSHGCLAEKTARLNQNRKRKRDARGAETDYATHSRHRRSNAPSATAESE